MFNFRQVLRHPQRSRDSTLRKKLVTILNWNKTTNQKNKKICTEIFPLVLTFKTGAVLGETFIAKTKAVKLY